MTKIYALFFIQGFLLFIFSILVVSATSDSVFLIYDTYFVFLERSLVQCLSLVAILFSLLYLLTEKYLYSKSWSIMHIICFLFLAINICTYSFIDRLNDFLMHAAGSSPTENLKLNARVLLIRDYFMGSMLILMLMQLIYPLNLIVGLITRKSTS